MFTSAIIVAAGKGSRMESKIPKQFLALKSRTVLYHTISKFLEAKHVSEIILVIAQEYLESEYLEKSIPVLHSKKIKVVTGGQTRQDSVFNGLKLIDENSKFVLTHDGVRPLISTAQIDNAIEECQKYEGVIVATPSVNTMKIVDGTRISGSVGRETIWQLQTPQIFKVDILQKAFAKAHSDNFIGTDESSLVERISKNIHVFHGNATNIKITVKEDIAIAEAIMDSYGY